jgi:single-stranded-DNA-specific exonuclease
MENWVIKNKKADFQLIMNRCGVSEVMARCLVNKGLSKPEEIDAFFNSKLEDMHDPYSMKDMKKAAGLLSIKIKTGKKIRIIGDYDVDGVISTYVLYRTLQLFGAQVDIEIPDRIRDGYGINIRMVEAARRDQVDTILTCDNGIVAIEQINLAKEYGMTVIVTDHHSLYKSPEGETVLPKADAVINPNRPDCPYPYKGLCGAVIAYKLMIVLMDINSLSNMEEYSKELLSYAAIATVCDVMELTGENRIIVKYGLQLLKNTPNKGLKALMAACGIEKEQLSAFHLGFIIGPCLNASGRLDTAKRGLKLLLAKSNEEAEQLAFKVKNLNDVRKEMTAENVNKAMGFIEGNSILGDKILVVYLKDCHESIAGIIAGRIRERYHRPAIILTDAKDCVKGSARSIEGYNMIEELSKQRHLLSKVGGHPMAAGLSMPMENVGLLRRALNQNTILTDEMLVGKVSIDILLPMGYISENLINELKQLEPFGKSNERPLFAEKNLKIISTRILGKNACGIKLRVVNKYRCEMDALYFGNLDDFFSYIADKYGEGEAEKMKLGRGAKAELTITYYPKINEYNGNKSLQLMIQNYR